MSTADQAAAAVRQANARDCLLALRDAAAPQTVAEIAARTGLSRPTVDTVLQELVGVGPVTPASPAESTAPGRPARRFVFDPSAALVAGVDIGARTLRCTVTDAAGTVLLRRTAVTEISPDRSRTDAVVELVRSCCTQAAADQDQLQHRGVGSASPIPPTTAMPAAVGIAVPGILSADDRIAQSLTIPDWVGVDLVGELTDRLGCPVTLENDIKLAAYAEHHIGTDVSNLVFLQLGNRISVALIVDGKILQGSHRLAGELGSQRGMRWTQSSRRGQLRWSTGECAEPLFARAAAGDSAAAKEIDRFCAEIAPKITALLLTVDPELVVVGGGLSRAGATLLKPLQDNVHRLLMTNDKPDLVAARMTTEGAVTGALGHAFEHRSADIFGIATVPPPWRRLSAGPDPSTTAGKST